MHENFRSDIIQRALLYLALAHTRPCTFPDILVHMHLGECNYRRAPTRHGRGRRGIYRGGPDARVPDLRGFEATIMARNRCPLACTSVRVRSTRVITRNNARLHT